MKKIKSFLKNKKRTVKEIYNFSRQFDGVAGYCTNINGLCEEDYCRCNKQNDKNT